MSIFTPRLLKLPASARVAFYIKSSGFSTINCLRKDPRLADLGKVLKDEYSVMRDEYGAWFQNVVVFPIVI